MYILIIQTQLLFVCSLALPSLLHLSSLDHYLFHLSLFILITPILYILSFNIGIMSRMREHMVEETMAEKELITLTLR